MLAKHTNEIVGGVALRPLDENGVCEMKRLFVHEPWRGHGIGGQLIEQILFIARNVGYAKMRLDTEKRLKSAGKLYRKHGFVEIERYYDNPLNDIIFMKKDLSS